MKARVSRGKLDIFHDIIWGNGCGDAFGGSGDGRGWSYVQPYEYSDNGWGHYDSTVPFFKELACLE